MTKVTGIDDSLSGHARLSETSFLNSNITSLTRRVVSTMRTSTIETTIVGADPIRRLDLIKRTSHVLATLAILVVSGGVVI